MVMFYLLRSADQHLKRAMSCLFKFIGFLLKSARNGAVSGTNGLSLSAHRLSST